MESCPTCNEQDPGNGLFCRSCHTHIPGRSFAAITTPPWAATEALMGSPDTDIQIKATDDFLNEKKAWTKTSSKYRNWEASRTKEFQKNKPAWRKERMKKDPTL